MHRGLWEQGSLLPDAGSTGGAVPRGQRRRDRPDLGGQAPTWLVQFPALLTPDRGEILRREVLGATPERMLREIGDALEAIASRSPLVIVFEDLQWVDYSTVDLISVLARRRTAAKVMLVGTYRDDEVALSAHPLG